MRWSYCHRNRCLTEQGRSILIAEQKKEVIDNDYFRSIMSEKVYTTRLGGNQVQALADVSFSVEEENTWQSWESPDPVRVRC